MYRKFANKINHTHSNDMRMITSMTTQGVEGGQLDSYDFLTHDALALASLDTINDTMYAKNYHCDWLLTAPTYRIYPYISLADLCHYFCRLPYSYHT